MRLILTAAALAVICASSYAAFAAYDSHAASKGDGILYWRSYHDFQRRIADTLRDPDSAKFKSLYFRKVDGRQYMCGLINARNGMGGYIGFRPFYVGGGIALTADPEDSGSEYSVERVCLK